MSIDLQWHPAAVGSYAWRSALPYLARCVIYLSLRALKFPLTVLCFYSCTSALLFLLVLLKYVYVCLFVVILLFFLFLVSEFLTTLQTPASARSVSLTTKHRTSVERCYNGMKSTQAMPHPPLPSTYPATAPPSYDVFHTHWQFHSRSLLHKQMLQFLSTFPCNV